MPYVDDKALPFRLTYYYIERRERAYREDLRRRIDRHETIVATSSWDTLPLYPEKKGKTWRKE